ncbi:peptidyl-tRNA hydrolase [Rickenella mellea]|uniref:Peptidyl-tRNA hydrolase n=1 Tax=Rickenella mellea TaxID=50990 RepID=A0A4Y7QF90_9AGAM|nr:peptidyl-tRNA hydrolase [Rickenella mellea]
MQVPRILLVGLGNIPYPNTRHSVGHLVVDSLAARLGARLTNGNGPAEGFFAQTSSELNGQPVDLALYKPMALMNVLGHQVAKVRRATVPSTASMIVIHDDLNLTPATVKRKFGGSPSGHRGVRSVLSKVQSEPFHRLQIGIGRRGDAKEYVLGRLDAFEREFWGPNGEGIDLVWEQIIKIHLDILRALKNSDE